MYLFTCSPCNKHQREQELYSKNSNGTILKMYAYRGNHPKLNDVLKIVSLIRMIKLIQSMKEFINIECL